MTFFTASGRKYITGVSLDKFGHVVGLTTGTETVTDTHYENTFNVNAYAEIDGEFKDANIRYTTQDGLLFNLES